jgi:hypothetical protein
MTSLEKIAELKVRILPDTDTDEVLGSMISLAEAMVLDRMYPFGYPDGTVVPARYEQIQIQLAVELYGRRGAEGQTSHSENGINRSWSESSPLLKRIVPHCGSVMSNA